MSVVRVEENMMLVDSSDLEVSTILVKPEDAMALMVLGHGSGTPNPRTADGTDG